MFSFYSCSPRRLWDLCAIAVVFATLTVSAAAQTFRGAIAGTITDASGAALAGADIKALNEDTGLAREVTSGGSGEFAFQDLPLGKYTVTVSRAGFQTIRV